MWEEEMRKSHQWQVYWWRPLRNGGVLCLMCFRTELRIGNIRN